MLKDKALQIMNIVEKATLDKYNKHPTELKQDEWINACIDCLNKEFPAWNTTNGQKWRRRWLTACADFKEYKQEMKEERPLLKKHHFSLDLDSPIPYNTSTSKLCQGNDCYHIVSLEHQKKVNDTILSIARSTLQTLIKKDNNVDILIDAYRALRLIVGIATNEPSTEIFLDTIDFERKVR